MKLQLAAFVLVAAVAGGAYAQAEGGQESRSNPSAQRATSHSTSGVYLCTDANGNKEYRNTGVTRGCKKVDLPGLTTVPAPKRQTSASANGKKSETASANGKAAPNGFPKVDGQTQKTRDGDRKQILQDELRAEEEKLAKLKAEYKGGEPDRLGDEKNYAKYQERTAKLKEDVERSEKNVDALKREIANLK
jgi:hypothetical protein